MTKKYLIGLFPSQTWWWDHDAHRGKPGSGVTGFGSLFLFIFFPFLSLSLFYLSVLLFQSQVLRSHPNERSDYEIWGSKTLRRSIHVKHAVTQHHLSQSIICGALKYLYPVWVLHGRCQLFSESLWLVAGCKTYSMLKPTSLLPQPIMSTDVVLHAFILRTQHAVLFLLQTGATSVSFEFI